MSEIKRIYSDFFILLLCLSSVFFVLFSIPLMFCELTVQKPSQDVGFFEQILLDGTITSGKTEKKIFGPIKRQRHSLTCYMSFCYFLRVEKLSLNNFFIIMLITDVTKHTVVFVVLGLEQPQDSLKLLLLV